MNYTLVTIFCFSIAIPAFIGIARFKKIEPVYYFFLILVWTGLINEILNFFIIRAGYSNAVNSNIYSLAESLLISLFFKRFGLFDKIKWSFYLITGLFGLIWIIDNFIVSSIREFSSYFTIVTSFTYVLMSVSMINRLIVSETKALIRNPVFLICIGFTLFFTYALLVEIYWVYGLNSSLEFRLMVYRIMTCINLAVNLIYALAVLWMPRKREYILL